MSTHRLCSVSRRVLPGILGLLGLAATAHAQEPAFRSPLIKLGAEPTFAVAGDLDGDGDVDLVTALKTGAFVVSLKQPGGAWSNQPAVTTGTGLGHMALGDLNGDGRLDLAYVLDQQTLELLVVRLGTGAGGFGNAMFNLTSMGPSDVDLADLDGDGDLDAVLPCIASQRVSVLLGNGNGTFAAAVNYAAGALPLNIAVGDWNGDTVKDLAIADTATAAGQRAVSLLFGVGDGTFGAPVSLPMPAQVHDVETGDFDADGALDLAVSQVTLTSVLVLFGHGDGLFDDPLPVPGLADARKLAVADLDEDGDDDIATNAGSGGSDLVGVLLSLGDRTFAPVARYGTVGLATEVTAADVTDDGDLDLVAPGAEFIFGQALTLLEGNGRGAFRPNAGIAGNNCSHADFGDLDGDGRLDMVAGSTLDDVLSVFPGEGNGFFGAAQGLSVNALPSDDARPLRVALADFDADGALDIAVGVNKVSAVIDVFFGNGDLTFQPFVSIPVSAPAQDLQAVDLEGDGDADLVMVGTNDDTLQILRNDGAGSFATPDLYATANNPYRLTTADMNGDGTLDVVATTGGFTGANFVHVFLGNGDGTVQPALSFAGGTNHGGIGAGDADGDGDVDIAVSQSQSDSVLLLLNDGSGFLAPPTTMSTGVLNLSGVVIADFDRDGIADIATAGSSPQPFTGVGALILLRGMGGGTFAPVQAFDATTGAEDLVAHDIDGDGVLDLAVPSLYDFVEVFLDQLGPWNDLGHPLPGSLGLPKQVGEGSLQSLQPFRFTLSDSRKSAPVAHVIGLTAINAPFKGGVFVPAPTLINFPLFTDATGDLVLAGPWPPGAGGLTLYFQFWFPDPAAPFGHAASNAVSAAIPLP